jgi:methionyl-tRNA formyltransferase
VSDSLRLGFAGTPDFAVPALDALVASRHTVAVVLTQPDRPAGRGRQLAASAVKVAAQRHRLAVEQPATLKTEQATQHLRELQLDVLVVVAYGLILPAPILAAPRLGCLNIHASLLPRWRGAAPIARAILAGDTHTGISIMQMDAGLDTGPVRLRRPLAIAAGETAGSLEHRLAALGAQCIVASLDALTTATAPAEPQRESEATYARKIEKSEAVIDWTRSAAEIERAVRAFNPRPVAETRWRGAQLRIWSAHRLAPLAAAPPGTVVRADGGGLVVACGEDALGLDVVQLPGKKPTPFREFLHAHAPRGDVLGGS